MLRFLAFAFFLCALRCSLMRAAEPEVAPDFNIEVMSILSKSGCNAGTCHGNLNGKGGLKLSLRGQDPHFDWDALVTASRGRRVNVAAPAQSLFLMKATGSVAHRGGIRFDESSPEYQQLLRWLQCGAAGPSPDTPRLERLSVEPQSAVVDAPQTDVQILVRAFFSDGSQRDVTQRACYELSNLAASVSPGGRVTRQQFGETTLIVRYLDLQIPVPIAFTQSLPDFQWQSPSEHNFIDHHVFAKLRRLRIQPAPMCEDHVFVRRAFLDAIGRAPTMQEAQDFVWDQAADKRLRLVDRLLATPEFADFWALKFADILRVEEKVLDPQGVELFHAWIRQRMADGQPLDQFVRALVTGTGSTFEHPAANYYRANRDAATRGETTARLFLGTRLQCAKCHNHPFDRWTQDDYYQWASLFSQIDYELGENKRRDRLDKNEFAGDQIVLVAKQAEVQNPNSHSVAKPKFLGGQELDHAELDRLNDLGAWLTAADNQLFIKSQANFVWYHLLGQGLVDPIDDFRLTNPASNPPLLDALAEHLVDSQFDLRQLIRSIMLSRTYQASSEPQPSNQHDHSSYSKAIVRRLPAEVLLDMQSDFLDSPVDFSGHPLGMRAVQIPGGQPAHSRDGGPTTGDRFLKAFGKPERIQACECERSNETNLKQVLGLVGESLNQRLVDSAELRYLTSSPLSDSAVVDRMFWRALSRPPTDDELSAALRLLRDQDRATALQDIAWALLNAKEFLFRR